LSGVPEMFLRCCFVSLRYISIIFCFLLALQGHCSVQSTFFQRITVEDGLPINHVNKIIQDKHGFVWVGTFNGLTRYDGYSFKVYKNDNANDNSLVGNLIRYLFVDKDGHIWIGTESGLSVFNPANESFIHYRHDPKNINSLSNNVVNAITQDKDGDMWIGTRDGLNLIDFKTNAITRFMNDPKKPQTMGADNVWSLYEGPHGVWVGTNGGLSYVEKSTGIFRNISYSDSKPNGLSEGTVWSIVGGEKDLIWLITEVSLHSFDTKTGAFTHHKHDPSNKNSLGSGTIFGVERDSHGNIWIGTSSGLTEFEVSIGKFKRYMHKAGDLNSLGYGKVMTIMEDREGNIWSGTDKSGLSVYNAKVNKFGHYRNDVGDSGSLSSNWVSFIIKDSSDNVWVGSDGDGIDRFSPEERSFVHHSSGSNKFDRAWVNSIVEGLDGVIWFGSSVGLNRIDSVSGLVTTYPREGSIQGMIVDEEEGFWLGTDKGLAYFNIASEQFSAYIGHEDVSVNNSSNWITSMIMDSDGGIWIGTLNGLDYFDTKSRRFVSTSRLVAEHSGLSHGYVNSLALDRHGGLWIGTMNGLSLVVLVTGEFTVFGEADGLPDSTIYSVEIDNNGFIWMGTNRGLSRLNPSTGIFKNYTVGDGLQGREFNAASSFKSKDGELFFGGTNGLNRFYPDELVPNRQVPKVVFTEMLTLNKPVLVKPESNEDGGFFLKLAIYETPEIVLTSEESLVTFEFSAMQFLNPYKNKYAYKLEGFDEDWIYTDYKNRRATYTGLPDGDYVLQVKASNSDGAWSDESTSLKITVLPWFWDSWKAYFIYLVPMLVIFLFMLRSKRKKEIFEQELIEKLELKVSRQTASIKKKSEKIISANKVKSQFLVNMSHEIRTPLTSIIGRAEAILCGDIELDKEEIKIIYNSSLHLLSLLNDTLDLSKIDADRLQLEETSIDLTEILLDVENIFLEQAESKGLKFILVHDFGPHFNVDIDGFRLKQILINLCSNALKFTDSGDVRVEVCVDESAGVSLLEFAVIDTGIGMSKGQLADVFDEFTQADSSISRRFGGSGLGLNLSQKLARIMGGVIDVESVLGQGTVFTLSLPFASSFVPEIAREVVVSKRVYTGVILLADDHDDNRELVSRILKSQGFEVRTATNGYEVIESYSKNKPDLILLDIQMPEMDGIQALEILRAKGCDIPIIALTANTLSKNLSEYLSLGFDGLQAKPFERKLFIEMVGSYFEKTGTFGETRDMSKQVFVGKMDVLADVFKQSLVLEHKRLLQFALEENCDAIMHLAYRLSKSGQIFGMNRMSEIASKLEVNLRGNCKDGLGESTRKLVEELSDVL
jgi:signal transduction histidine kinase/ligand-binding sensor domain-containing protein/response regulator of citrate/malate metabolism